MMVMTDRDYKVIEFIKEFKCASTTTLTRLFFTSQATAERRLKKLVEHKKLHRTRDNILSEYHYYIKKRPTNIKHSLIIADIYSRLMSEQSIQMIKYKREYEIKFKSKSLRADLMAVIKTSNNKLIPLLVEIDLTKAYKDKYKEYIDSKHYQQKFPIEPTIIIISDKTPKTNSNILWYKLNQL